MNVAERRKQSGACIQYVRMDVVVPSVQRAFLALQTGGREVFWLTFPARRDCRRR